jgi:hypothetical protein
MIAIDGLYRSGQSFPALCRVKYATPANDTVPTMASVINRQQVEPTSGRCSTSAVFYDIESTGIAVFAALYRYSLSIGSLSPVCRL